MIEIFINIVYNANMPTLRRPYSEHIARRGAISRAPGRRREAAIKNPLEKIE